MSDAGRDGAPPGNGAGDDELVDSREETLWDSGLRQAFAEEDGASGVHPLAPWSLGGPPRHELGQELGRGGIGRVHAARDLRLGREIAIKLLHEQHLEHPDLVARFVREAQIAARLQHPGVVPIYDFGVDGEGRPWIAMRRVEGQSLAQLLAAREDPRQGRTRWLSLFVQVCQTIGYAHGAGIVHRDLKPANVLVGAYGEVQVTDWGFAKDLHGSPAPEDAETTGAAPVPEGHVADGADPSPSLPGTTLGTPGYLSPEQARGAIEAVDRRSDVFALGAVLFEILTGRPVYTGKSALIDARRAALEHVPLELRAMEVEARLVDLTLRCLAPDPAARPNDASELAEELAAWLDDAQTRAHAAEIAAARAESRLAGERRARRLTLALGVTLAVLLVAITSYLWSRRVESERRESELRLALQEIAELRERGKYEQAMTRIARAQGQIEGHDVAAALRQQLASARTEIERTLHVAVFLRELERVRLDPMRGPRAGHEYETAFGRFGLQPFAAPELCAARLRTLAADAGRQVAAALVDWALCGSGPGRGGPPGPTRAAPERAAQLLQLADACDPEPTRVELRRLAAERMPAPLRTFVESFDSSAHDVHTHLLLARLLERGGPNGPSIAILEHASRRADANFWVHVQLARHYHRGPNEDPQLAAFHAQRAEQLRGEPGWRVFPERR